MIEIRVEDHINKYEFTMLAARVPVKGEYISHRGGKFKVAAVTFMSAGQLVFVDVIEVNKAYPFPM
jgi:nucleoside diphosphate kinase